MIADEAHRSQYDLIDGLAGNLRDSPRREVCEREAHSPAREGARRGGQAVRSPGLNQSKLPKIDGEFEAIIPQSRDEELTRKEKLKTKWAALEALVGFFDHAHR